jgi:hypothetical protein
VAAKHNPYCQVKDITREKKRFFIVLYLVNTPNALFRNSIAIGMWLMINIVFRFRLNNSKLLNLGVLAHESSQLLLSFGLVLALRLTKC